MKKMRFEVTCDGDILKNTNSWRVVGRFCRKFCHPAPGERRLVELTVKDTTTGDVLVYADDMDPYIDCFLDLDYYKSLR